MLSPALGAILLVPLIGAGALFWRGDRKSVRIAVWTALVLCTAWASVAVVTEANPSLGPFPGPMGSVLSWTLGGTSGLLALAAGWLVVIGLAPFGRPLEDGPPAHQATALIFLSVVLSALTVDDLLIRVISLDLGSLIVCALLLLSVQPSARLAALWNYALLFLGDLAFLAMALVLHSSSGTWNIDSALNQAVVAAPGVRWTVLFTGLLAAWVKLALPPLGRWLRAFGHRQRLAPTLVASAGPPLLGAYLLYRLRPLAQAAGWPATAFLIGAVALSSIMLLWRWAKDRDAWEVALGIHALLGAILLFSPLYRAYLVMFVPVRLVLCIALRDARQPVQRQTPISEGAPAVLQGLAALATRYDGFWTRGLVEGVSGVLSFARATAVVVDARGHQALERAVYSVTHVGNWLSGHHSGKLRRSLLWALFTLIPVLFVLFFSSWEG